MNLALVDQRLQLLWHKACSVVATTRRRFVYSCRHFLNENFAAAVPSGRVRSLIPMKYNLPYIKIGAVALHAVLFCLITSSPPVSQPVDTPTDSPDPAEVAILEELVEWVDDDRTATTQLATTPLAETIRQRPHSFELFRNYHADTDRREQLHAFPYGKAIARVAERHGVDGLLLAAIVEVESGFNPEAVSVQGAVGLMQVLPSTAGAESCALVEPSTNLDIGAGYLSRLLRLYEGDLQLALAAYNAGPGAVRKFGGVPPYRETQRYVEKVLGIYIDHHRTRWQDADRGELLALL